MSCPRITLTMLLHFAGLFRPVHSTQNYIQITGLGDFTKINVAAGDEGGELGEY